MVDDSFVQPQPGTSATDHLVGGLVPLAVLGLAAFAYPRLRAGWRADVALLLGVFGLGTASEAWYYTREVGASGDDYTGLLAIPAGLMLLAVGVVTLWRSRRLDERMPRRYVRRALLGLGGPGRRRRGRLAARLLLRADAHRARGVPEAELGAACEDVSFTTDDGLELEGWYVPSKNRAAVIAFPGRKGPQRPPGCSSATATACCCSTAAARARAKAIRTRSAGTATGTSRPRSTFLRKRPDVDPERIGGMGLSVGGELMLETAAETTQLKAVVPRGRGSAPCARRNVASWASKIARGARVGWDHARDRRVLQRRASAEPERPGRRHLPAPGLPHLRGARSGRRGPVARTSTSRRGSPSSSGRCPGAKHTGGIETRPREYERRMIAFFDGALRD